MNSGKYYLRRITPSCRRAYPKILEKIEEDRPGAGLLGGKKIKANGPKVVEISVSNRG